MATFEVQVEGITGIALDGSSSPTQDELTQFLRDGVLDVTSRTLAINYREAENFQRSTTSDSQGVSVGGAKIISVMREANADGSSDGSTAWRPCRKIPASLQSKVVDVDSLHFSSIYNPVYAIENDHTVNVYPVPSSNDAMKIFYVNEEPRDITNNAALTYAHENIKYFPNNKVYLVVMYASMKALQAAMGGLHSHSAIDTTAFSAVVTQLNKVDDIIVEASGKIDAFYTSIGDIDDTTELWDNTNKRFTVVRDAMLLARDAIDTGFTTDEDSGSGDDAITKSAGYWLADEDAEMASSTLQVAQTELQRAQAAIAEINSLMGSYSLELEGVPLHLQEASSYIAQANGYMQEIQTRMGRDNQLYTWFNKRYQELKAEYNEAFYSLKQKQEDQREGMINQLYGTYQGGE